MIAGLLLQVGKNRHIKKLRIGKNVNAVKPKYVLSGSVFILFGRVTHRLGHFVFH